MEHTDKKRKFKSVSSPTSPTNGKSSEQIIFAVPKKGRLYEKCVEFLKGAGLDYTRTPRLDIAQCNELPVTLVFLPAADIAQYVGEGNVDMGITGKDIIGETGVDVVTLMSLEFGKCKLAVQAPIGKYKSAAELAGQRVVTSFPNLARKYFDKFDTSEKKTSIKYVSGSVEVACGLGLADGIVDLVETGTTMKAAGLEAIETVMETETVLISNPKTTHQKLVKLIQKRIEGYLTATKYYLMTYNIEKINFDKAKEIAPGHESPTVSALKDEAWISVSVMVRVKDSGKVMDQLHSVGARSILCLPLSNCRF